MSITMSQRAAKRIQTLLERRGHGIGLRLGVKTSGCTGLAYLLEYIDQVDVDDVVFQEQGITVVVQKQHLIYLDNITLDFVSEGLNEGFKFVNPNIKGSCGCGKSFHV